METTSIMFDNKSFLSNYYECPVRIGSYIYPSSENAYHSFKFDNIWLHHHICEILQKVTPDEAKHFVRELKKNITNQIGEIVKKTLCILL